MRSRRREIEITWPKYSRSMPSRAMVVVGGGASTRFGQDKLMIEIDGRTLIEHTIDAVIDHVDVCVVVCREEIGPTILERRPEVMVTAGGPTRTRSEISGLSAIDREVDLVGIHDAARPLITGATIEELYDTALREGGAVPLVKYRQILVHRETLSPIPGVHGAQTPQVFRAADLMAAYSRAREDGFEGYDTVEVMQEYSDVKIIGVQGDSANLKVTYPEDLDEVRSRLSDASRT